MLPLARITLLDPQLTVPPAPVSPDPTYDPDQLVDGFSSA